MKVFVLILHAWLPSLFFYSFKKKTNKKQTKSNLLPQFIWVPHCCCWEISQITWKATNPVWWSCKDQLQFWPDTQVRGTRRLSSMSPHCPSPLCPATLQEQQPQLQLYLDTAESCYYDHRSRQGGEIFNWWSQGEHWGQWIASVASINAEATGQRVLAVQQKALVPIAPQHKLPARAGYYISIIRRVGSGRGEEEEI